jgi:nucleotide-binding universal stress UspA family protein
MAGFKRILVLNRLSQYTRDAVRYGVALARCFEAELSVLRLISNPVDLEAVNAPSLFIKGEEYKNFRSIKEQYQDELEKDIRAEVGGTFPVSGMVTDKEPLREITTIVREGKFDLLVILAHEQTRLEHMLFGENEALIRSLPCSILLMKHEPRSVG